MTLERHSLGALGARCALVLAAVLASACAEPAPSPSLTVRIDAPDNAKIDVTVSGPDGFKKTINATTTFDDIAPGQYKVELVESRKRIARPVIDDVFVGTVDQPTPRISESTTVVISFEREPGSGHVWVPVAREDKIVAFSAAAFEQKALPSYELKTPAGSGPDAIAFRLGDLWVAFRTSGEVAQYDAMTLAKPDAASAPVKTIPNLGSPSALAFDKNGELFVAEASKRAVTRFSNASGKPSLTASWRVDGVPGAIAFDADGSMFVATTDPPAVRIFTPAATPATRPLLRGSIVGAHTGLVAPSAVAFGTDGTLWVTNGDRAPAVRFESNDLARVFDDVDVAPTATLAPPAGESFNGLAFDKDGQGWFTAARSQAHELRCGVAMQTDAPGIGPAVSLGVASSQAFGGALFAFNPPPAPSPIRR